MIDIKEEALARAAAPNHWEATRQTDNEGEIAVLYEAIGKVVSGQRKLNITRLHEATARETPL